MSVPRIETPLTELTAGERELLRIAAEPEQFLGKVLQKMLDYGENLKQSLVSVDLMDPVSVNAARKVQATIIAIAWVQDTFDQAMTEPPSMEQPEGTAGNE